MAHATIKAFGIVFFGSLFANVAQYAYNIVTGRLLGPAEYGILVALISLATLLYVPFTAAGIGLTKEVSRLKAKSMNREISFVAGKYFKIFSTIGFASFIVLVILSPIIADFLHTNVESSIIISASIVFMAPAIMLTAILNGTQSFKRSMVGNCVNAFGKLLFGAGLVLVGFGLLGAVGSVTIGALASAVVCVFFLKKILRAEKKPYNFHIREEVITITAALVLVTLLNNIDIILAKHFLESNEAGLYVAASQIGKIIFFLTGSLTLVLVPKISEIRANKGRPARFMVKNTIIITAISLAAVAAYAAFPGLVVGLLYGSKYAAISPIIWITGMSMTLYSIIFSLTHYFITIGRKKFVWLLAAFGVVQTGAIYAYHSTFMEIAAVMLATMALFTLIFFIYAAVDRQSKGARQIA